MTYHKYSNAVRCLVLSGIAAALAATATAQGLRPPPDYDMPMGTKPMFTPKTLAGLTSGPVTMARFATNGYCPISFPYGLSFGRDDAFAKFQKEGFKLITLPAPGPGAPPIQYLERTINGIYQKVTVSQRRRRGGGGGGGGGAQTSTALLVESVPKGSTPPARWPKVARVSFDKFILGKQLPGNILKGKMPERVCLIEGDFNNPVRWESIYALPNDFDAVWRDLDSATNNKDWTKKGRRTWGELRNTSYQTVTGIDVKIGPPMRSEGLTAKTFVVVFYKKK